MNESYKFWMMTMYGDSDYAWYVTNHHQGLYGSEAFYGRTDYYYQDGSKVYLPVYATIRLVIKVHKCELDGGCYNEDVELNACYADMIPRDGVTIIEVDNTKKIVSMITIILSTILFVVGFAILSINYIKYKLNK